MNPQASTVIPQLDLDPAAKFLAALDPAGVYTFQTFADRKTMPGADKLAKVLHGTFDEHRDELLRLNEAGAGIFVMVNEGDGTMHEGERSVRSKRSVTRVRAVFVDLDGSPIEPVLEFEAPPHIVVESSPGKWHAYWLVSDVPLDKFGTMQQALIERFHGDKVVKDLPRVLRIPGFLHQKADPCPVRLVTTETSHTAPYTMAELLALIGQRREAAKPSEAIAVNDSVQGQDLLDRVCADGDRTEHLIRIAGSLISKGLSLRYVIAIAKDWNARNIPPLDDSKVESTCEGIHRTHQRNHPEKAARTASAEVTPLFPRAEARIDRYITQTPPPRRWLLVDCLPQGKVGALIAPGGTGKSQFLLQLAAAVATGQPFLGWTIGEPGGVLCLFAEDDDEEIHRRLHRIAVRMGSGPDADSGIMKRLTDNLHIKSMVGLDNLMTSAERMSREVTATNYADRLMLVAREIPNLKLIVIDPGSRFRGGDENFAQDTTRFIEVLEQISRRSGANVLVAHHANKGSMSGGEQSQSAQRGSSAFTDGVRWQMNLTYLSKDELSNFRIDASEKRLYLTATVVKNNYGPPGTDVILRRDEDGILSPVEVASHAAADDALLLQKVKSRLKLELGAGKSYTRAKFENDLGGSGGEFKIGKTKLRTLLKNWVRDKDLVVGPKKVLYPDNSMASRYQALSDKNVAQSTN